MVSLFLMGIPGFLPIDAGSIRANPALGSNPAITQNLEPFPRGFGVNIHFTHPKPGEMELLQKLGVGWIRNDLAWSETERQVGRYDFSNYDFLFDELERANIRPLFILDYGNGIYQSGPPTSDVAIAAHERWVRATVSHYKGKKIVWEIWNEPNLEQFWKPKPDADAYARLAVRTAKAIRETDPGAVIIAPGCSGFDWSFLETCFQSGLLQLIDGVSVHPYRSAAPETVIPDYKRLRGMIRFFSPNREVPIVCSEWGYSTFSKGVSEAKQASYLSRMWATNLSQGIPLSIFYDWKNDGPDPKENEHRFGLVTESLVPKPAFDAARSFLNFNNSHTFLRVNTKSGEAETKLLFVKKGLDGSPQHDDLVELTWKTDTDGWPMVAKAVVGELSRVAPGADSQTQVQEIIPYVPAIEWAANEWKGRTIVQVRNEGALTGDASIGVVGAGIKSTLKFSPRDSLIFPWNPRRNTEIETKTHIDPPTHSPGTAIESLQQFKILKLEENPSWRGDLHESDVLTKSFRTESLRTSRRDPLRPLTSCAYTFTGGWQYVGLRPNTSLKIPLGAVSASVWIKLDGTHNILRSRIVDADGFHYQINLGSIDDAGSEPGWRLVTIPLDGPKIGVFWGGKPGAVSSGVPNGPLTWDCLFLIDSVDRANPQSGVFTFGPIYYLIKS